MVYDYLIIGQGVSGTFLSYFLQQQEKTVLVIDLPTKQSPSHIAAGIINPVTGRRMTTAWMAEQVMPFAWEAYTEIGNDLGITAISHRNVIDFFPNPFMREGFLEKIKAADEYVFAYPEQNHFNPYFNYEFGCGEIRPAYSAHMEVLLPAWRNRLISNGALLEEWFDRSALSFHADGVRYRDIMASKIIYCDGPGGFENPQFSLLPYSPNKGEALVLEIPGLPAFNIYKKSMLLVPMTDENKFWIGSSYAWKFDNPDPTQEFLDKTKAVLDEWLKLPYKILEHRSGLRPATMERRPFCGIHPHHPQVAILNGMGTKGCSLAPFFAKQLADHLVNGTEITPDADVKRFTKILSRSN
ncbi:MAG: FAD-binding oxidoreductase [Chitinophagaceae bacterium]|nr:MAG: FAD-binding oxidoreductase [Chitinophagaceae bacterium]